MGREISLGRIAGIKLAMSWAVPFIALIYVIELAQVRLPFDDPGLSDTAYWVIGAFGAACFFASLLAHEIGHALVARSEGIGVLGISLWLLGGVTRMEHEARTAGAELRIAAVGPLASAAMAGIFWGLQQSLAGAGGDLTDALSGLFGWLAFINLLLAAFNLLPGSPLDGGRVLSAIVWKITGSRDRADAAAARTGQALGWSMVAIGLFGLFGGAGWGLWVLIVGGFIGMNATAEARSGDTIRALRGVRVAQVMNADPPLVPDWSTVADAAPSLADGGPHHAVPVQAFDGRIIGLLTAAQVRATDPVLWSQLRVGELAFPIDRVQTALVDDDLLPVLQRNHGQPTDQVLVLWPDGRVAGILSAPEAIARTPPEPLPQE